MRRSRGFTLIELMIAGVLASLVAIAGFVALTGVQTAAARQRRATELISQARVAMELMGRDIRQAGDSIDRFNAHCTGAVGTNFKCAAILEPHPWRLVMARNTWDDGIDDIRYTEDDIPPIKAFTSEPQNVVAYQFVKTLPTGGGKLDLGGGREGVVGRLERIVNPFKFLGQAPQVTVLLDNVLLDNRMRVSPDGTQTDPRFDFALFMYQLLSTTPSEFQNASFTNDLVVRNTQHVSFLLPPMQFFDPFGGTYTPIPAAGLTLGSPYLPAAHAVSVVGLRADATRVAELKSGVANDTALREVLDRNRIRTVRVAFHVIHPVEDAGLSTGIDLDDDTPGTALSFPFETTFELKVFSSNVNGL